MFFFVLFVFFVDRIYKIKTIMRLALILDPLEHIKTYKDTSFAIMREAPSAAMNCTRCSRAMCCCKKAKLLGYARRLEMRQHDHAWYVLDEPVAEPLSAFDAVLMRKDPPFDMEYVFSTYLLELAEGAGRAHPEQAGLDPAITTRNWRSPSFRNSWRRPW